MKRYLVTVTDNISPTSMPFNEFTLYRRQHFPDEKQIVILLFKEKVNPKADVPEDLELHCVNKSVKALRKTAERLFAEAERDGAQVVLHIHEGKSVLLWNLALCGRRRKRIVYTLHSTYSHYAFHNKLFAAMASVLSAKVVCVSQTAYSAYPALLKRLLRDRVTVIRNGVDCDRISRALAEPACGADTAGALRLVCVARLIGLKRQDLLLRALASLPDASLTLIGEGPDRQALQALAAECGVAGRVRFLGLLPRDEVYREIARHHVFVSASAYEGLPISLLEAMRCGVMCVVSDIGQHREIREECPSLITVPDTLADWERALRSATDMGFAERARIGAQNRRDVERCFSLARMHTQYERVYAEIAEGKTI